MTTRKELQEWLNQFPESAVIEVITTEEGRGWEPYTSVYQIDLDLTEKVDPEFNTYGKTFEIERPYTYNGVTSPFTIRLGVKN